MDERVKQFREIAIERGKYLLLGNARKGNKCYDKLKKIYFELKEADELYNLAILLEDEDDRVKFEAAQNLLPHFPEESKNALAEIAPKMGSLAFVAKETLKWWSKKELEH